MALTRKQKLYYSIAALLVIVFFILPFILGLLLRGTVEAKVKEAVNAPVSLGSLSVKLIPPGATLGSLEIGSPDAAAANAPLVRVGSLHASISLGTVFGGPVHITSLSLSDVNVSASVDDSGVSSFARFIRGMPVSTRKDPMPIDSLRLYNVKVLSFLAQKVSGNHFPAGTADSTLEVDSVRADSFELPAPGALLGRELWTPARIDGLRLNAPSFAAEGGKSEGVAEGVSMSSMSLELAQAISTSAPVKIRHFEVTGLGAGVVYSKPGEVPCITRSISALQAAFGEKEPAAEHGSKATPPAPKGTGLLIEDLAVKNSQIETRGPDASGKQTFWRLKNLSADGKNLAIGPEVKADGEGMLKASSESESTSGSGSLLLDVTKITGGYPKSSFECEYKLDQLAAQPFSTVVEETAHAGVIAGQISMAFSGPATHGALNIDGSITLSKDFNVTGTMASMVTGLERGMPIKTVRIRGTLDNYSITWPSAIAGALGNALEKIAFGGTVGVFNTASKFMGSAVDQGIRETGKVLQKVPKIGGLFGGSK